MVTHSCHGEKKLLTAKRNCSRQKEINHGKKKSLTSKQNEIAHGKNACVRVGSSLLGLHHGLRCSTPC